MRASVDASVCVGHSLCLEIAPEVFAMEDDDDVAHVLVAEPPEEAHEAVRQAERACPARAIRVGQ
jgi:ferredoxin